MASLTLCLPPLSPSTLLYLKPPLSASRLRSSASFSNLKFFGNLITLPYKLQRKIKTEICRADFSKDMPFAAALGACVLTSLLLPVAKLDDDEAEGLVIDSTDTRFAAMGIISFIPYFNWLSWVFAWLDTGKRRYAVYSLAYLIPYIRSNLSISPEESWLPIASIVLCIIHVQVEASLRNGDIQGFQLFNKAAGSLSSMTRKKQTHGNSEDEQEHTDLPSGDRQLRNEIRTWRATRKPAEYHAQENGDWSGDNEREQ